VGTRESINAGTINIQERNRVRNTADDRIDNYNIDSIEGKSNLCRGPFRGPGRDMQTFYVVYLICDILHSLFEKNSLDMSSHSHPCDFHHFLLQHSGR
jgi:hypothetical protein